MSDSYAPGVCNIGPAEIRVRRRSGYAGLAVTVVLYLVLVVLDISPWWRLFLLIPAFVSASGFIQASMRFCAGFGMRGLFNFTDDTTRRQRVEQAEARRADRRRSMLIQGYALALAVIVTVIALLIR